MEEKWLDPAKSNFKLNHFVLWTKGWYVLKDAPNKDKESILYLTLKKVLGLDGYAFIYNKEDIINILCNNLREYNDWASQNEVKQLKIDYFIREVYKYIHLYNCSYFVAVIGVLKNFFGWDSKIALHAPAYNSKLTKYGLIAPNYHNGVTYTQLNKEAMKINFLPAFNIDFDYLIY